MPAHGIDTILATLRLQADQSLSPLFDEFERNYEQKLWHQLTKFLQKFFEDEKSVPLRLRVYDTFVFKVIDKLNQLSVIEFLLLSLKNHSNYEESLHYLYQLKDVFKETDSKKTRNDGLKNHNDGLLLIDIEIARIYLYQNELVKARDSLDEFELFLENNDNLPLMLVNTFYSVSSQYFKMKNDFNQFYYTSLLYLSTIDNEHEKSLSEEERKQLAYDLSIAALLGDKIYNFGELLQHPIISSIAQDKQYEWLLNLLTALTIGDFKTFDDLIRLQILEVSILAQNESFLRQKICLMTLVESVFAKNIRMLSFDDISTATHLAKENVEHLVMKSISLGLLKGSIDQVNEIVNITWVQPRIINFDQITKMNDRLLEWNNRVTKLGEILEKRGKSIWV